MMNFYYGAMGCGKSTKLIQMVHNYKEESKKEVLIFNYEEDKRYEQTPHVSSRLGIKIPCIGFNSDTNFITEYKYGEHNYKNLYAIFVDESQFLSKHQVLELSYLSDNFNIIVNCFGLRSDSNGDPFTGSIHLLTIADKLEEIESIDKYGDKATMQIRLDENGERIFRGPQKSIGLNYAPISRKRFYHNYFT